MDCSPEAKPTFHHELRNRAVIIRKKKQKEEEQARLSPPRPPRKPRVTASDKTNEMMARTLVKFINQSNSKLAYYMRPKEVTDNAGQQQRTTPEPSLRNGSRESGKSSKEKSRHKKEQRASPMKDQCTEEEGAMIVLLTSWLTPSPFPSTAPPPSPRATLPLSSFVTTREQERVTHHRSTPVLPLLPLISEVSIDENRSAFEEPVVSPSRPVPPLQEMVEQKKSAFVAVIPEKKTKRQRKRKPKSADDWLKRKGHSNFSSQTKPISYMWERMRLKRNYYHARAAVLAASEEDKAKMAKPHNLPVGHRLQ